MSLTAIERLRNGGQVDLAEEVEAMVALSAARERELTAALPRIADKSKPGQEVDIHVATDLLCDVWNIARAALASQGGKA